MIYPHQCYKKLGKSLVILSLFQKYKEELVYNDISGFSGALLPLTEVLDDPILHKIHARYKIARAVVLKMDEYRSYIWHRDMSRGVCVNMLLTHDSNSFVLFGNNAADSDDQIDIIKLEYEPSELYLFNNQAMHTVINFKNPRHLFSIEFELDKNMLTYEQVFNFLRTA